MKVYINEEKPITFINVNEGKDPNFLYGSFEVDEALFELYEQSWTMTATLEAMILAELEKYKQQGNKEKGE